MSRAARSVSISWLASRSKGGLRVSKLLGMGADGVAGDPGLRPPALA